MNWKVKTNEKTADPPTRFFGDTTGQNNTFNAAGGSQDSIWSGSWFTPEA
jgi:hypothetical protein